MKKNNDNLFILKIAKTKNWLMLVKFFFYYLFINIFQVLWTKKNISPEKPVSIWLFNRRGRDLLFKFILISTKQICKKD